MLLNTGQRLALNIDSHIVVDAGAGTGKTSTIVDRDFYLDMVSTVTKPEMAKG